MYNPQKSGDAAYKRIDRGTGRSGLGPKGCERVLPVRDLEEKLALIRNGDGQAREDIIDAHRSFVTRVALKVCGRSLEWDRDDELIIGMTAFNEAIDRFDENRGVPFQAFARLIIKSRITDFLRRQQRHHTRSAGSLDDSSTQRITAFEVSQAWDRHLEQEAAREREEEIAEYQKVINELGISFDDLVKSSPKHRDSRSNLLKIARQLAEDRDLFSQLMSTGRLPVMAMCQRFGVNSKTIERGRKYIIATSVIWHFCQDFLYLCSFIKLPGKGSGAE